MVAGGFFPFVHRGLASVKKSSNAFKISNIQASGSNLAVKEIISLLDGMTFNITISKANSRQLDSNIDERIEEKLDGAYRLSKAKNEVTVQTDGEKIGELDLVYWGEDGCLRYLEIEKTNKKTLWFDYVKILTKLADDSAGLGVVLCPSNYAHQVGVWNLYKEAVAYKGHLRRLFGGELVDRVGVVGYTQYALIGGEWVAFNSHIIKRLKGS